MSTPTPEKQSRRAQFAQTYRMAKRSDPRIGLICLGWFLLFAGIGFGVFWFLPGSGWLSWTFSGIGAFFTGLLAAVMVFGRRAQRAAYNQMDGQLGAGAAALNMLRRGWKTYPMVAFTKQQDMVHRVVGPPGIVLVGEGSSGRLKQLMTTERKNHERVMYDVPLTEIVIGKGEGQVPLSKLVRHVQKMKRQVKPAEMTDIVNRIKALDAARPKVPMPKGPVPTSMKGMRQAMRGQGGRGR
ncbi:DUF4191 domain-containing protein [Nocardioides limicola]|uniref:DUF4191 domain-containing protein n=1 Tax=Nocardioides limicola TaxID=2803368 RepID=UPI00193B81D6|nr:DUF4191 domain-containing protein [Nocardioides sp. DJM-14]